MTGAFLQQEKRIYRNKQASNLLKLEKQQYLSETIFHGIVPNRALPSLHGESLRNYAYKSFKTIDLILNKTSPPSFFENHVWQT